MHVFSCITYNKDNCASVSKYLAKMKGCNSKDSSSSPTLHSMYIKFKSTKEEYQPYQFKLPAQNPRKNRFRLQYKMGKSRTCDTTNTDNSPNSNLDYDCCMYNSFRVLSRSAKIMRALSFTPNSFRDKDVGIRKLLNFDSSPSPRENSSYENSSSSISADTPSPTVNSSLTDSTDSNIPAVESIDENQNQTPQRNRKNVKISSNRTDVFIFEHAYIQSRTSHLMSMLERERKEGTNKDTNRTIFPRPLSNQRNESYGPSHVITMSIPRNLSQEFNQEIHDRPHTPENMINVIPESISAIKRSHKKEKLYYHEEQSSTQQTDVSVKNDDLHPKTVTESSGTDVIAKINAASESESQKKNRNTKRTLIYNLGNECPDIRSDFDRSMQQKNTSIETDSLESGLNQIESDEMQDIASNDCESNEENMQISFHLTDDNDEEEDRSEENACNEEISQLSLQKESPGICNVNATSENRTASPESNLIISQDTNKVVTPENHVNVLKHVLAESIKKSHKKMKHGDRKKLLKMEDLRQEMELKKSEILLEDGCNDDQDIKSQTGDTICVSSSQNFEFDRSSTPENVNSSRLLLLNFNSVKKSHKKDKRSKRASSFAEYYDYENRKRSNNSLQSSRYEEENIDRTSRRNESLELEESPNMSPKKKKLPRSMSLQSSTPKMPRAFMSLGCKDIDDQFQICTPIKKPPMFLTVTGYVSTGEIQERDEPAQAASNEIDCSRCVTPIARFKELRRNENLASKCDNATGFKIDISVLKAADAANLEDENGRSTPINMSTMKLLHNIDSIKKSHKKDKHNRSKRPTSAKKRSYIQEGEHVNFINSENILEECTPFSLKHHVDDHRAEDEICSIMCEKEKDNSYKETDYDNSQPSTSRGRDNIEDAKNITVSKFLNTPPNSSSAKNRIKLLHKTSIKKSHKKERDMNAQIKYIFMSQEHELSDDGSIFDEEDKSNFMDINDNNQENDNIIDK